MSKVKPITHIPEDAQSEWVHMMMKRLERLESDNDKLREEVDTLRNALDDAKHHIKRLERVALKYNGETMDFTDQSALDWLIWEPLESAYIYDMVLRKFVPIPEEFLDARIDYPDPPVEFMMPASWAWCTSSTTAPCRRAAGAVAEAQWTHRTRAAAAQAGEGGEPEVAGAGGAARLHRQRRKRELGRAV